MKASSAWSPSKAKKATSSSSAKHTSTGGGGAQTLILGVLAEEVSLVGKDVVPRARIMTSTGLAAKTLANAYTKLKQKGWIEMDAQNIRLTDSGKTHIASTDMVTKAPKTNQDRHNDMKTKLTGKQIRLFDILSDGRTQSKNDVALALDYEQGKSTKAFQNLVATLKSKGFVEYPTKDTLRLTDVCFPRGRESP